MTEKGPKQWRIQGRGPGPPLFSDQTEARRADKIFFGDRPPSSKGLDDCPPLTQGLDPALLRVHGLYFANNFQSCGCLIAQLATGYVHVVELRGLNRGRLEPGLSEMT